MLQQEKYIKTLQLTIFFSFFLFTLSYFLTFFLSGIKSFIYDTILSDFITILNILNGVIFKILTYTSFVFFVGALITLFVVFINDYLINQTRP